MHEIAIELTNACNLHCLHCLRNKADPPQFLPLTLAQKILIEARSLGFRTISLTGGELALYPHLEEFLAQVVEQGYTFKLVTNGHRFRENLLPHLSTPKLREKLEVVCLSLDGPDPESHDALRGSGSFRQVVEAASLCELKGLPFSFKSVITNFNKDKLMDLALLASTLGARDQSFLNLFPTPRSIRAGVIPDPGELRQIMTWIQSNLMKALRLEINIEGFDHRTYLFNCHNILDCFNLDFQGNLILCCNLSHVTRETGQPSILGREWLGDLREMPLREGLIRHYYAVAQLMESRVRDAGQLTDLTMNPCCWCLKHFGKLEWLRDFPESPWSAGVLEEGKRLARA